MGGTTGAMIASQGVSTLAQIGQGMATSKAANKEAKAMRQEADYALQEARAQAQLAFDEAAYAAEAKAREVRKFRAEQSGVFRKSGVTLEGSPLLVLEETRRLGAMEVDFMMKRGKAQADFLVKRATNQASVAYQKAANLQNQGRSALLGGIIGGVSDLAGTAYLAKQLSANKPAGTKKYSEVFGPSELYKTISLPRINTPTFWGP